MSGDNVRLLGQINERTQKLEGDINKVWPILDEKVSREDCLEHRTLIAEKVNESKKIALGKRSKAECQRMFDQLREQRDEDRAEFTEFKAKMEEERKESKSDKWMWMATIISVIALLVSAVGIYFRV